MLISLTVGKVDAGVAVLLTQDKRLIEFPSILLPPSITSGSIVDITVSRNFSSESASQQSFANLQSSILQTYGLASPEPPVLRCRNATQTSIVLEWDRLSLATASFRSLSLYRNGAKAGNIPFQPGGKREVVLSTKISGLAVDTEYVFHLVLRTSAGTYASDRLSVRTHKMTDLTGITVTPGFLPQQLLASLANAVERIGGKIAETVRIDTTHFVCTEGRGREWERAVEINIPVVRPEWVEGCEREGRIVGVRGYYLNADPKLRQVGQGVNRIVSQPQTQSPQQPARTDRRDMAISGHASPDKSNETPGQGTESTSRSNLPVSSPPPPIPAKDDQLHSTNKEIFGAGGAITNKSVAAPEADTESEDELANSPPSPSQDQDQDQDKSNDESEVVSPVESEDDKSSNALGISGISKLRSQAGVHGAHGRDANDEEGAKSPEDGANFSEVQL